jgi:cyclohexanecarboxyl-CoA dehydrogenase
LPHTTEAAMCKWWAVVTAVEAVHGAMLLHGHSGYTKDLPHAQRMRDIIGMEWGDGTAQIQKLVIARSLIGRDAIDARRG